jgi:hypothetical protein
LWGPVGVQKAFTSFAVGGGRLITGQNPESGGAVAKLVIKEIKWRLAANSRLGYLAHASSAYRAKTISFLSKMPADRSSLRKSAIF